MLISKEVKMRWNSKNKRFYEDKGYTYTKMRDEFYVRVEDLKEGSNVKIQVKCDYCGNIYEVQYYSWKKLKGKDNNSDCCSNPECTGKKSLESLEIKYGDNFEDFRNRQKEKREQTNLEKYGYVNPFQNELIKSKNKKYKPTCHIKKKTKFRKININYLEKMLLTKEPLGVLSSKKKSV